MLSQALLLLVASVTVGQTEGNQTTTREDFAKYCEAMQGRWFNANETLTDFWPAFSEKGKSVVSHAEIRIVADGNALEGVWYGGTGASKWMEAWDAKTNQIRKFCVMSDGTLWQEVRFKKGDGWQCVVSLTRPNGTEEKFTSVLTMSADGDTHTYKSWDPGAEGKEPGVYKRVAR